ncbi:MAG TPA: shikimate dehydrogenase [Anaeromyxobacter sp.]|nr:shikimate dehydrogenase [Anaeromyxobacter sp.]
MITGRTALYGVIGHPVAHSRSPEMQNAAFARAGIDAVYVALPVPPERVPEAIAGALALGFSGLNVTVPHKQAVLPLCASLDPAAREIGAVNTLRRGGSGWEGFNTDAPALAALLEAAGVGSGARALLVGAGGAARAGAWALARRGAEVRIAARRPEAARALAGALGRANPPGTPAPRAAAWEDLAAEADAADVVVNGTSVGLPGHEPDALPGIRLRSGQVAADFVYGDTAFARAARAAGARLVTGEQILVRQGALAFALWTGRPAPEAEMASALASPAQPSPARGEAGDRIPR